MPTDQPPAYRSVRLPEDGDGADLPPDYTPDYDFEKPKIPTDSNSFEESFKIEAPKYNDKAFTVVFISVLAAFALLTFYCFRDLTLRNSGESFSATFRTIFTQGDIQSLSKTSRRNNRDLLLLILATIGVPILCSMLSLLIAYGFPMFFVFLGYFLIPFSLFSAGFALLATGSQMGGLLMLAFGGFSLMFIYQNYSKLSFTSLMLKIVISVMRLHPSTILISFLGALTSGLFGIIYLAMSAIILSDRMAVDNSTFSVGDGNNDQSSVSNLSWAVYLFIMFVGYYAFEVIKNLVHVTTSGVYGSWYFFEKSALKPLHPALSAFKRGITYCFGSICFGSLIVSLIKVVRQILNLLRAKLDERRMGRSDDDNDDDGMNSLVYCCLSTLLSLFDFFFSEAEYWIKWFNQYAYSYLALYGEDYLKSAKDTFEIFKYKGMFILINDCLIGATLSFYAILNCILSSSVFMTLIYAFQKYTNVAPEFMIAGFVLQILLAYFITSITLNTINSGFITFLIALCIQPEKFDQDYHAYFVKMTNYYPEISQSLRVPFRETA